MKTRFIGWAWRRMPSRMRRFLVRLTQPSFTVSVGAVIFDDEGRVLLLNHVLRPASGWGIGGGFMTPGEQPADALRRELLEETGLEVTNLELLSVRTIGQHVEIIYRGKGDSRKELKLNQTEIMEARWFNLEEMPAEISQAQRRQIENASRVGEKQQK